jgi:hypothetical protein
MEKLLVFLAIKNGKASWKMAIRRGHNGCPKHRFPVKNLILGTNYWNQTSHTLSITEHLNRKKGKT